MRDEGATFSTNQILVERSLLPSLGRAVRLQREINNVSTSLRRHPPSTSSDYHTRPSSDHRPLPPTLSGIRQTLFCFLRRRRRSLIPDRFFPHEIVRDLRPRRLSISKKVQLDTLDKALSVLTLLKDYGFDEAHLVRLVDRLPGVLVMNVEKILKPKLELFRGISLVGTALPEILSAWPVLLGCSLEKRLLPNAELLKSILITNANLVNAIKNSPWLMAIDIRTKVLPKVDALRAHGVADDVILVLLIRYGHTLVTDTNRFNEAFDKIKKMGICPKKTTFAHALGMLAKLPEKKWVEKVENFMGLGWSQDNVLEAFSKQPYIVRISTEKTRKIVEFLEEKLGWTPEHTVKYPVVLLMSLEKRLLPRCAVLSILMHKGLIKPGFTGCHFLMSSKNFQMEFVTKFQEKAPEIVEVIKRVKS